MADLTDIGCCCSCFRFLTHRRSTNTSTVLKPPAPRDSSASDAMLSKDLLKREWAAAQFIDAGVEAARYEAGGDAAPAADGTRSCRFR